MLAASDSAKRSCSRRRACLGLCALLAWLRPAAGALSAPTDPVDRAVRAAAAFLAGRIDKNGLVAGEAPPADHRFGGKTALCAQALLTAGAKPDAKGPLARALAWLGKARLNGTYAVAMRAGAWSLLADAKTRPLLRKDTAWLIKAMNDRGGYTYTSSGGLASETQDNSNAQMALLGIWAGARRGVEVPLAYWNRAERYWLDQQQPDGGWGYRVDPRTFRARTYGSMTAAGLASLFICFDNLRSGQFIRCEPTKEDEPIRNGLAWLGKHFAADENPGKGVEWYHYWLYCAERVGLASGHKYFASHDWYAEGCRELLTRQNPDGSWGYGDCVTATSFALMFLARGREPVLINKLRYDGKWNARPRDLANLTRWLSTTFERPVAWQIVHLDSPLADWHEAPFLYLSGAGPVELKREHLDKLRTFVRQGGTLLSEAACNSGDFTLDVGKLYARLFADYPLIRLPAGHAIYSAHFQPKTGAWLAGVTNGVRLLAIHAPRELSLAMQLGPGADRLGIFQLLANIYMHTTDRGQLRPRESKWWPVLDRSIAPRATIRIARLKHPGNCDPEPLAWRRLAILVHNRLRVRLDVSEPMDITALDAAKFPVAHMTGTDAFELSKAEGDALRKYLAAGGTLVVDAAGGSRIFSESVRKHVWPLAGKGQARELAQDHPLYLKGPYQLKQVRYRRDYALTLDPGDRTRPRLQVFLQGERLALIHSREDLTFGLLAAPAFRVVGYTPRSAERLMTNIVFHLAGVKAR